MATLQHQIIGKKQRITQFRIMLSVFFVCLLIPLALIVYYGFQQFENDMEFQYQSKSVNVLNQINKKLNLRVKTERKRSIRHYSFYQWVTNPLTGEVIKELSPLADPTSYPENLGLIGYFQINADKTLSSPLLPYQSKAALKKANTHLLWPEIEQRLAVKEKLRAILLRNNFVIAPDTENANAQQKQIQPIVDASRITKESFQVKISGDSELIIFRNFWVDQQHKIQGFIVEQNAYLQSLITDYFTQAHYEHAVQMRLKIIHTKHGIFQYHTYSRDSEGNALLVKSDNAEPALEQKYIHHGYIIAPFQKFQLKFTTDNYPLGAASSFVALCLVILLIVIIGGFFGVYWLGIKQIELAEQRLNFVSAVSHELKTPLTSILMYSEMLKSGMVTTPSTQLEYHAFIHDESSRLSRLISNILKLSTLNHQQELPPPEYVSIHTLQDTVQSKISSLLEKNAFNANYIIDEQLANNTEVLIDVDAFSQIVINLVDNSVKFFNAANITESQRRKIDISFAPDPKSKHRILFTVRDFGPGISSAEQHRIFELFYREGNEMTRTTPGTGIGLALVHELVLAQGGKVKVKREALGIAVEIRFEGKNIFNKSNFC